MRNSKKNRLLLGVFLLFLVCGVLFLMIMQTRWASLAAEASQEELKRNLKNNVSSAMRNMLNESQVILSLLSIDPADYKSASWDLFRENTRFLQSNTSLFDFTKTIFLLPLATEQPPLAYDTETQVFLPASLPLPSPLDEYKAAVREELWWNFMHNLTRQAYYITPIMDENSSLSPREPGDRFSPAALLAVKIDINGFYASLLAAQLEESLQGYPFKIRTPQKVYYISPGLNIRPGREPDFRFPLDYPLTQWQFIAGPPQEEQDPAQPPHYDYRRISDFRYILKRPRADLQDEMFITRENGGIALEIFYPGGPLRQVLASQTLINQAAAIGILGVLVISLLLLFRLYMRMQTLREKEQEFVATISHELRTPLAVIRSTSDNLSEGIINDNTKIRKYGQVIHNQAKRLSLMVENILHYAGLEGKQNGKRNQSLPVELGPFLEKLVTSLQEVADKKQARLIYREEDFRGRVTTDPVALGLILENLFNNAIHHGCTGPAEQRIIKLQIRKKVPRGLSFTIEDKGPGIPLKEQKKIFSPFFRGQESIRQHIPGSGLGLHLVKRVTELLGGSVTVESPYLCVDGHEHKGCRFSVTFPWEVSGE